MTIRIVELATGVLDASYPEGRRFFDSPEALGPETRRKFFLLAAADIGSSIAGVGIHIAHKHWWVDGDDPLL